MCASLLQVHSQVNICLQGISKTQYQTIGIVFVLKVVLGLGSTSKSKVARDRLNNT